MGFVNVLSNIQIMLKLSKVYRAFLIQVTCFLVFFSQGVLVDKTDILTSSFRDPSGFVYFKDKQIYRQINQSYRDQYEHLMSSGLYDSLVKNHLLVSHEEIKDGTQDIEKSYKRIRPHQISYISYPFEWSFSQWKDAALCTLNIQKIALKHGMILKDASAYNIQFHKGKPVFIDTLSFEFYKEGNPWVAYRQFCQHFIAPLALMAYSDIRLSQLFKIYIDGIPLDLASKLLPMKTWLKYSLLTHIHLHARSQNIYADAGGKNRALISSPHISRRGFEALMESIESSVKNINWKLLVSEWGEYYSATNYQDAAKLHKESLLVEFLQELPEKTTHLHDLGANNGHFSRIAEKLGYRVIAQDIDPVAVEKNYLHGKQVGEYAILPLLQDLTNPSGAIGWALQERDSFVQRCQNETVLALALIHHLAISNNVPLDKLADFFSSVAKFLIIEFVSKEDSQVKRLLSTREDVFPDYNIDGFEKAFLVHYRVVRKEKINDSQRILYLLAKID